MEYIAAYDFGTSGVKAVIVDKSGKIVAVKEKGYPLIKPKALWVEQRPEDFWDAVCEVTHGVLAESSVNPIDIKGINFSVQAVTFTPVDENGNNLYNAISWLDGRAQKQAEEINSAVGATVVRSQDAASRMLWIKENLPEVYSKTKYFLDCNAFLQYKCTGIMAVEDDYDGILWMPEPIKQYYDACYCLIDKNKIPPMVEACCEFGKLDERGASDLGLCQGTSVFGGMIDVSAAAAGCGCLRTGDAHVYFGSSGWVSAIIDQLYNTSEGTYMINSITSGLLIYGGCTNCACTMQNWALERFYSNEMKTMGKSFFSYLEGELGKIPDGCDGLYAAPWLFGEQFPFANPDIRAMYFNITDCHTNAHFMKATLESLCFSMRGQLDVYNNDTGKWPSKLMANGGGSLSEHWMQMLSDITGLDVEVPENTRHSGAVGAALGVAIGLGWCNSDDVGSFIRIEKTYRPNDKNREMYDKKYKIWNKMYESVKELYSEINHV